MHFATLEPLLAKGDVVLWEMRGMGLGHKKIDYPNMNLE